LIECSAFIGWAFFNFYRIDWRIDMDANFKPVRIGGIELLERFPCGKYVYYHCRCLHCGKEYVLAGDEVNHHHRSCGCLGRKQTKPNIDSNLPVIDRVIEHRSPKEK
jgi:hypothetical protein